jgi:hypothetical protein
MGVAGDPVERPPRSGVAPYEWGGILGLSGLLIFFLRVSWRRWPDPLVDFGRELYLPWRLAHGAVLYRDADDFYGPLSQYLNAALFRVFGPGLIVLVYANLAVFLAIAATLYVILRRAWGAPAALVSTAVFVSAFGFSQPIVASNFNYATPYAHEATHGLLACLLLLVVLSGWVDRPTAGRSFWAGLLFGVAAVLKAEIMFAACAVTLIAVGLRVVGRLPVGREKALSWCAGALLPTLLFGGYFSRYFSWPHSLALACRAWLSLVSSAKFIGDPVQLKALGFDAPWAHLREQLLSTAAAVAMVAGIAGAAWLGDRMRRAWARPASWVVVLGGSGWVAWSWTNWFEIGRCLLGLTLIYLAFEGRAFLRVERPSPSAPREGLRLLAAVLTASLMARMLLHGRIYQFGFYQAALSALVVAAVLIGELPGRLRAGPNARTLVAVAFALVLAIGVGRLAWRSDAALRLKTVEIGVGRDRFYAFPARVAPSGELVQAVTEALGQVEPGSSLVVLPEGEMVNYLVRMPSPVAPFFFFSAATEGGGEAEIVGQLGAHPPKYVVVISRNLQDYGLHYYGESYGQGRGIMEWVEAHYQVVGTFGGNPIDPSQQGAVILSRGE